MVPEKSLNFKRTNSIADYFDIVNITFDEELPSTTKGYDQNSNNASEWGPIRDPLYIVIPITIIYAIIFITGVIGNISTCIVISRNKSMHTATNYYLFSLAISDLLLLVSGLPPEMYYIWSKYPYVFGEAFCVIQGFAAETSANATVLTITAFTVERYVAICHPFLSHTMSKLSRAIKFIMAIWLVALCLAVPQAMSFGIVYQHAADGSSLHNEHYVCAVARELVPHAFELSTLVFFVAPMSLISILYVLIGLQLRKSRLVRRGSHARSVELKHRVSKCHTGQATVQTVVTSTVSNGGRISDAGEEIQGRVKGGATSVAVANSGGEDGRKNYPRNMQHTKATKHVVNMLVAVVVAFFICWAPFHAQRLLAVHGHSVITPDIIVLYTILTYISGVLYYLSTCINPFLYHIMSNKFRNAFRETLSRYIAVGGRTRAPARRYSTLSLPRSVSPTRSQSLSNSGGTSRQASLRYVDADMSRRPLVVSFRKPNNSLPMTCIHAAHCSCSRNGDSRRHLYSNRIDHNVIKETPLNEEPPMYTLAPPKIKRFKKWGRRRHDSSLYNHDSNNISCKIICSECHRYLNKDSHCEREHKVVVITRSLSRVLSESPTFPDDNLIISNNSDVNDDKLNVCNTGVEMAGERGESDLIPHHRCPNRHDRVKINRISNSSLCSNNLFGDNVSDKTTTDLTTIVPQSKTMPDIVKYVLQARENNSVKSILKPRNSVTERSVKFNRILEDRNSNKGTNENVDATNQIRCSKKKWGSAENLYFDIR